MSDSHEAHGENGAERTFEEQADAVLAEAEAEVAAAEAEAGTDSDSVSSDLDAEQASLSAEEKLQAELAERTEDLQRLTAEYANFRRRTERDRLAIAETAKVQVVAELLDIVDDLGRAAEHGDLEGPLKSVNDKLAAVLTKLQVVEVGAVGEAFDPERHEAVADSSTGDDKVIGTVLRKGYALNDRLVRTAMVMIADPE